MIRTIEYIESVVCCKEGISPELLKMKEKKAGRYVEIRQIVMFFSVLYGHKIKDVAAYYGFNHANVLHAKSKINGLMDVYEPFRDKIKLYTKIISDGNSYKADYLSNVLNRLKKETKELEEQLKTIAI